MNASAAAWLESVGAKKKPAWHRILTRLRIVEVGLQARLFGAQDVFATSGRGPHQNDSAKIVAQSSSTYFFREWQRLAMLTIDTSVIMAESDGRRPRARTG
jgi:hypothetical protein